MTNRAKYCQSQAESPPTAWTKIQRARDSQEPASRKSLDDLIALYDRPLEILFQAIVPEDPEKARDWKQDFVQSHLMSAKVFHAAKPGKRFRTFLAVCAKNFVSNNRERDGANKRQADRAQPFSQKSKDDLPFELGLAEQMDIAKEIALAKEREGFSDEDRFFHVLTWARAMQIYENGIDKLEHWARQQADADSALGVVQMLRARASIKTINRTEKGGKAALQEFKIILKREVREETHVEANENADEVYGSEIDILLAALDRKN